MWVPDISFSGFVFHKKDFQWFENYKTFPKMGFPNGIIQRSNLQHHFIAKQESSGATIWKTIFPGIGHSLGVNSEYPPGGWTIVPNCTTCSTLHYLIAWYCMVLRILKNTDCKYLLHNLLHTSLPLCRPVYTNPPTSWITQSLLVVWRNKRERKPKVKDGKKKVLNSI